MRVPLHLSVASEAEVTPAARRRRRVVALVALLIAAALTATVAAGSGAAASAAAAGGGGGPIRVLFPRPGAVIVAGTARGAHRLRLAATVSITRRVRGLGLRLNGHLIHIPARSGRLRVRLDAADGLELGENLLWVSVGGRDGNRVVPFVVGYRHPAALAAHLHLGTGRLRLGAGSFRQRAGSLLAALANLRVPRTGVDKLLVTLNGVRLPTAPDGGATGRLSLDLPQLGTVHWGANRVQVRLIMMDGRIADWTRTFQLNPRRDIAVARLDGRAIVGRTVALDARRSLIVPGVRQARGFRWVLLSRPPLSHVRLGRPQGARITLRPDVPGYYRVGLVVGHRSQKAGVAAAGSDALLGYDVATVAATYAEPLVPFDTITPNDPHATFPIPGIRIGDNFYQDPGIPGQSLGAQLQFLELDRATLGVVRNVGMAVSIGDPSAGLNELSYLTSSVPSSDFAIVTVPGTDYAFNPSATYFNILNTALAPIGGSLPAKWTLSKPNCWSGATDQCGGSSPSCPSCANASWQQSNGGIPSFTIIGIGGLPVGQAWRATAVQYGRSEGNMVGYFTQGTDQGSASDYTVINGGADQYEAVNTCAPPNCDVQIGYPGDPHFATYTSPGPDGLQVLEVDRTTLALIVNRTVTTEADFLSALTAPGGQQQVGHFVGSLNDQRLVIIRTVGNGRVGGLTGGGPLSQAPLLQYIDELGGTPDLVFDAMSGRYRYALVGAATDLPWRNSSALESSTEIPWTPPSDPDKAGGVSRQTGQISGVLQQDRTGLYTPLAGDPVAKTSNSELYHILYQAPTSWPYADDTQDLKSIADQLGLTNYPDVRSAYYRQLAESWSSLRSDLETKVKCPHPQDECDTFDKLKADLDDEFLWVQDVQNFASLLLQPYSGDYSHAIQQVYDDVKSSIPPPPSARLNMGWLQILTDVMHIASGVAAAGKQPELSGVFGALAAAGSIATYVMETQNQPGGDGAPASADTLYGTAAELSDKLDEQVTTYRTWIGQMEEILLRDYAKLKAVGTHVQAGDPGWEWGTNTTSDSVIALKADTRASAYSALVPAVWPGYNLKPSPVATDLSTSWQYSNNTATRACDYGGTSPSSHDYPFKDATHAQQFWWVQPQASAAPQQAITTFNTDGSPVYQAWVFAQLDPGNWASGGGGHRSAKLPATYPPPPKPLPAPPPDLTYYLYGAGSTDSSHGAYQFAPVWWRDTYNPPSHTLCWQHPSNQSQNYYSTQYPPPDIPAPPP